MSESLNYFNYLKQRSLLGLLYRRGWLYPRLSRHLVGKALDIGCGIGDMLRARKNTVGVDINDETVAYCKGLGLEAQVMTMDKLPFEEASFDSAVLDNVLEHIENPKPLLAEVRRVLRPGGVFIVGVPGARGYQVDPDHKVFYDAERLQATLAEAGFSSLTMLRMPLPFSGLTNVMNSYCIYGVFRAD
ncbi:MAG: class I SAM-dependent methyltransferase [Agarilytica sp.]